MRSTIWAVSWRRACPRKTRRSLGGWASSPSRPVDAALSEAEARLGKDCTLTYHQHLEEHGYFTRVHVNGKTARP